MGPFTKIREEQAEKARNACKCCECARFCQLSREYGSCAERCVCGRQWFTRQLEESIAAVDAECDEMDRQTRYGKRRG